MSGLFKIIELKKIRRESPEISKARPERTWDNFFLNLESKARIKISGGYSDECKIVELYISDKINYDLFEERKDIKKLVEFISENDTVTSLNIKVTQNRDSITESSAIASSSGIISVSGSDSTDLPIIPSDLRMSNKELAESYDKARLDES